jgi:hypothetical protein
LTLRRDVNEIAAQKCFNHRRREAVARCPGCGRTFCRECITEHEGRAICAGCLGRLVAPRGGSAPRFASALLAARCALGFAGLWLFFYAIGQALLRLPSSFHEGTLWRVFPWEKP